MYVSNDLSIYLSIYPMVIQKVIILIQILAFPHTSKLSMSFMGSEIKKEIKIIISNIF